MDFLLCIWKVFDISCPLSMYSTKMQNFVEMHIVIVAHSQMAKGEKVIMFVDSSSPKCWHKMKTTVLLNGCADGIINRSNGNPLFLQRNKHRQESIYNGIFATAAGISRVGDHQH